MKAMTPSRPYFVKAIFDWILENECTPYLSVFSDFPNTDVPVEYVEDGQITLNISPTAVGHFHMDQEAISFSARFGGVPRSIFIPMGAIIGLYAKENGHGMAFPEEPFYIEQAERAETGLSAVESVSDDAGSVQESQSSVTDTEAATESSSDASSAGSGDTASADGQSDDAKSDTKKSRSHLKVIK